MIIIESEFMVIILQLAVLDRFITEEQPLASAIVSVISHQTKKIMHVFFEQRNGGRKAHLNFNK